MIHRDREQGRAGKARAMTKDFIEYDSSRIASGSGLPYRVIGDYFLKTPGLNPRVESWVG